MRGFINNGWKQKEDRKKRGVMEKDKKQIKLIRYFTIVSCWHADEENFPTMKHSGYKF